MVSGWFLLSVGELRVVKFNWDLDAISSKLIGVFVPGELPASACEYNNVNDETTIIGYISHITREWLTARLKLSGTDVVVRTMSSCLRCRTRQILCLSTQSPERGPCLQRKRNRPQRVGRGRANKTASSTALNRKCTNPVARVAG